MARAVDVIATTPQAQGYNMVTQAAWTRTHNSLAEGCVTSGLAGGGAATGCPGGSFGTGANADVYTTPVIEAV